MASGTHEDHTEPTLFATAFPIWLAAIAAMWIFIANFGYAPASLLARRDVPIFASKIGTERSKLKLIYTLF